MSAIDPISFVTQIFSLSGRDAESFYQSINMGEILKLRIMSRLGGSRYEVDIKGFKLTADSTESFEKGQEIRVSVDSKDPHVRLRIINDSHIYGAGSANGARVMSTVSVRPMIGELLGQLEKILAGILSSGSSAELPEVMIFYSQLKKMRLDEKSDQWTGILRNFFNGSSHRNIMAGVSKLIAMLSDKKTKTLLENLKINGTAVKEILKQLVNNINSHQQVNKDLSSCGLLIYMQIPFSAGNNDSTVEIRAYRNGENDRSGYCLRIKAALELAGEMIFILNIINNDIDLVVLAESLQTCGIIREKLVLFKGMLQKEGFSLKRSACFAYSDKEAVDYLFNGVQSKIDTIA